MHELQSRYGRTLILTSLLIAFTSLASDRQVAVADAQRVWKHGVVAADHPLASAAGAEILKKGGNVVDAAVATSAALSVVRPESCGMGGGGFMVIWLAKDKTAVALDYRERAPLKAARTMYADPKLPPNKRAELSRRGHLAVAVPGSVAGWCYAQKHYGRLDLKTVLAPAIRLAREGVPPDVTMRSNQRNTLKQFHEAKELDGKFAVLKQRYLNGGKPWGGDDRFHSPQLKALELIARRGRDGFYKGPVAEAIVAEMQRGGGLISLADLAGMQPVVRKPLRGTFDGLTILTMPPASSGGVAILQMLNTLAAYETQHNLRIEKLGRNSPQYVHLLTETMKHAMADRAEYLGDADFAKVPVARLIDPKYGALLAKKIDPTRTFPPKYYGRFQPPRDAGTSHFCVIDSKGNAVACTETINTVFGSWVVEPKFGIVLNNEMDDFSAQPGKPNFFGLIQSENNAVAPRKKPLSSMSPTIVLQKGRAVFVAGASGGPRIITSTLQVFLNWRRFGLPPAAAVSRPRFHHQWLPDRVYVEPSLFGRLKGPLQKLGHKVQRRSYLSATQAAARTPQGLQAASDPRKHGEPAGY